MMERVYFTVATRDKRESVQAYLYDHSRILAEVVAPISHSSMGDYHHFLVETTAYADTREKALDDARRLGRYQADRLASGLHATGQVYDLQADAVQQHIERFGVDLQERSTA